MLFGRISLYFMTGFCVFGVNGLLRDGSRNQFYLDSVGHVGLKLSILEHSTADREVGGSIPLAPCSIIMGYLSKGF